MVAAAHRRVLLTRLALALALVLVAGQAVAVPDPDTEARCDEIDAMGGGNECKCSEPLITSGTVSGTFWNPPGSVTKPCVAVANGGPPLYNGGGNSMAATTGDFTAPGGISYGLLNSSVNGTDFTGSLGQGAYSVPTDGSVGRVCIRGMQRIGSTFSGNGIGCASVKAEEFNVADPSWWQFQGVHNNDVGIPPPVPPNKDLFWSAGTGVCNPPSCKLSAPLSGAEQIQGWCATEQCWYGDFTNGDIKPIARSYCINPSGIKYVDRVHQLINGDNVVNHATPVTFNVDRMFNWYRSGAACTGSVMGTYAMEAVFEEAGDSTGPWIGPPTEMLATGVCGNSVLESGETCDDGGTDPLDGCSATCQIETPSITRSTTTLTTSVEEGNDATAQTFTVSNGGNGTLSYSITDGDTWLSVSPTSGTSTGEADTITVTYDTDALAAGSYSATITITSATATNSPQTISVGLTVSATPAPPTIVFSPDSFTTSIDTGENLFGTAETTTLTVTDGPADYTISTNFAYVIPTPSAGNDTDDIDLNYAFTNYLGPGVYTATITATCPTCSPTTDTATVEITVANATPTCGDGVIETPEACDDDDTDNGDGCSSTCTIESGYTCTGEPSVCTASTVAWDVSQTVRTLEQNATTTNATLNLDVTGSAAWTIATDAPGTPPLYSLSPTSGTGDTAITLTFDNEEFYAPGTYTSTVTATCPTCTPTTATHAVSVTVGAFPDPTPADAAIATFPGAVGCGSRSYGGRGPGGITPTVYWVTTLEDKCSGSACAGSLRACVEASGPRYCLFNVSGNIELDAALIVTNPYLTVAGQTATGGIQITNDASPPGTGGVIIRTHDTDWRYVRFRPGAGCDEYPYPDPIGTCDNGQDGINIAGLGADTPSGVYRNIFDHVSVSFGVDENVSMSGARYATVQNSIISHPLKYSGFTSGNGYQIILRAGAECFSMVKNYLALGADRWPHHNGTGLAEVVNNVMYFGSGTAAGRVIDSYMARPTANVLGNLWKRAPAAATVYGFDANVQDLAANLTNSVYLSGNTATSPMTGAINPADQTAGYVKGSAHTSPYSTPTASVSGLDTTILPTVGASRALSPDTYSLVPARDSYDDLVVGYWSSDLGQVIEHESQALGVPYMSPHTTWTDTDGDGMPDGYEELVGLNASSAADAFTDADGDGYKNLEEFLDPTRVCGDGTRQGSETCDDGNVVDGDGCSASCFSESSTPTSPGGAPSQVKLLPRAF